ncbi:helix-turn-helix domain-containing protein [Paenibacillus pasadenensis]|uniref:response regulator transcription factor n=1 Tax=Paenibacillus pasadenensis TaxID=217090 RepID=UPI00203B37DC|nr:helix-turn-helix domain-containing protein [Paenibacillus pasadenensis]MCM3749031.1 helix-turn-helix domain-containing protein [Paenibacillus pasadenensis]
MIDAEVRAIHILMVDDDKLICENIKSKLTRLGYASHYTLLMAHSATEAEILYDRHAPEFVITDIHMTAVNGLTLIQRLMDRRHQANIVVLSSYDYYEYVRTAFLLGVKDYMLKPLDIDELDSKLKKLGAVSAKSRELREEEAGAIGTERVVMRHALLFIEDNLSRSISMRDVADHVGLSYTYFSRLFKEHTQSHFAHYVHLLRIERSRKYLQEPSFKIQDIAKKLGYENSSEYSRAFKKYTGQYPSEYRERPWDR